MRKYIAIAAAMCLAGCATNEPLKTSEVLKDARSAAFVQNGRGAASYVIGAVDGKTSWSNYSIMGERLSGPNQNKGSAPYITPTGKVGPDAAAKLRTLDVPEKLEDEQGRYLLSDPGTDVVVVFTLREVRLSEKPIQ